MATHSNFLLGEFHGQRSLAGYNEWGCKRARQDWGDWEHRGALYWYRIDNAGCSSVVLIFLVIFMDIIFRLWCWRRLLRVPSTARRSNQAILKEISPWIFIGRINAEVEIPVLWRPDAKYWLIWKDPDAGKDWRQEKGTTEDEMVVWHHWLNRHEFK